MKKICLLPIFHGMRFDSGNGGDNLSESFSVVDLNTQDCINNIVIKLRNTNPIREKIKFTEIKKK